MFGVALVERGGGSGGAATATATATTAAAAADAPTLELIWAISGQDNPAEPINDPDPEEVNNRLNPIMGIHISESTLRRATFGKDTAGIRKKYIKGLNKYLRNGGVWEDWSSTQYLYRAKLKKNKQQHSQRIDDYTYWFERILDGENGWGNEIGVCAGAKIAAFLSPRLVAPASRAPLDIAAGDRIICMAEVNHLPKPVMVKDSNGRTQEYGSDALTPSCASCQVQMIDFLTTPPASAAGEDEHKASAAVAAAAASSVPPPVPVPGPASAPVPGPTHTPASHASAYGATRVSATAATSAYAPAYGSAYGSAYGAAYGAASARGPPAAAAYGAAYGGVYGGAPPTHMPMHGQAAPATSHYHYRTAQPYAHAHAPTAASALGAAGIPPMPMQMPVQAQFAPWPAAQYHAAAGAVAPAPAPTPAHASASVPAREESAAKRQKRG